MAISKNYQTPTTTSKFVVKKKLLKYCSNIVTMHDEILKLPLSSKTVKVKTIIPAEFQLVFHVLMSFIHASIYWIIIGYGKTESVLNMSKCICNLHTIQ
jgi:hypothetical protein